MSVRFPLAIKVGLVVGILSSLLTGGGLYLFYTRASQLAIEQVGARLRDLGQMATLRLEPKEKEAILYLQQEIENRLSISTKEILALESGHVKLGLTEADAKMLSGTPQFQRLVRFLRKIERASLTVVEPPLTFYPQLAATEAYISAYLMAPLPQSPNYQTLVFLADSRYEALNDWPGNSPGNLYSTIDKHFFTDVFAGTSQTSNIDRDDFGTWITATIPLKDSDGRVYALLGLDYDLRTQTNRLRELQLICLGILAITVAASVLLAVLLAHWLNLPLSRLKEAAIRVQSHDFSVEVAEVNSNDELGLLGKAFNAAIVELRAYSKDMEARVAARTEELQAANREIAQLNERLKGENIRMGAELEIARRLQQMILPTEEELEGIPDLEIAGFMEPASEVGGDYYDVLQLNGRLTIGIGDVTGHGLESGLIAIMVQTAVRTLQAAKIDHPHQFINAINQALYGNMQRMNLDKSLTLAVLDYCDGILTICGQHEEVIAIRRNGTLERIDTFDLGFPIALEADISLFVSQIQLKLSPGDVALLYTDGITEAENCRREFYGLERLCAIAHQHHHCSAREIRRAIVADLLNYIDDRDILDDITLVVIKQN